MKPQGPPIIDLKIISGGQTGVDRAALDAALSNGLSTGGWCPRGRRACDGIIPDRYALVETDSLEYACRTELNVRDSDSTLILAFAELSGGTLLTVRFAELYARPLFIVDLDAPSDMGKILGWLQDERIAILNVAGPRESPRRQCYRRARCYLDKLFAAAPRR